LTRLAQTSKKDGIPDEERGRATADLSALLHDVRIMREGPLVARGNAAAPRSRTAQEKQSSSSVASSSTNRGSSSQSSSSSRSFNQDPADSKMADNVGQRRASTDLGMLRWLKQLQGLGLQADSGTFRDMLRTATRTYNLDEARWLVEEAKHRGIKLDAAVYDAVISAAAKRRDLVTAKEWIAKAVEDGIRPGDAVVGHAVRLSAKTEGYAAANQWLAGAGVFPTEAALAALVSGALHYDDLQAAEAWLSFTVELGRSPKLTHVNKLVRKVSHRGLVSMGNIVELAARGGTDPDAETVQLLVLAAREKRDLPFAQRWFERGRELGISTNFGTGYALIDLTAQIDGLKAAESCYDVARKAGFKPNGLFFRHMIWMSKSEDDPWAAQRWFEHMLIEGIQPSVESFNTLLISFARFSLSAAEQWFEAASAVGVQPDICTYNILISTSARESGLTAAEGWFARVIEAGHKHNHVSFNALMKAAMTSARPRQVEELFKEMIAKKLPPEARTFSTLQSALGSRRVVELCNELGLEPILAEQ